MEMEELKRIADKLNDVCGELLSLENLSEGAGRRTTRIRGRVNRHI